MKDLKQLKEQWAQQHFDKQYSKEELNASYERNPLIR